MLQHIRQIWSFYVQVFVYVNACLFKALPSFKKRNQPPMCEQIYRPVWPTHRVYFSGKEDKHEQGVGFLVHKDIVKSVIGCRPISSRIMTVRLRASSFNITINQVYAPTSWWQWSWWVLQGTPVSSRSNTKAGHSSCTRWLERESWRRCTRRLGRSLWTFLQYGDQWHRAQAPRLCNLQQPCAGKHPRQP